LHFGLYIHSQGQYFILFPFLLCGRCKAKILKRTAINFFSLYFALFYNLKFINLYINLQKYCNVLGMFYSRWNFIALQSQYTTVKHSQQLLEHAYTSDVYGLGTLTPIEFFQQDLLWQSSNTHSHSCSQKDSKHTSGQSIVGLSVHLHTTTALRRIVHH
jgi:hypothetical protein